MKQLSKILRKQSPEQGFPQRGRNGYGGEQDGSHVELTEISVSSLKEASEVLIPDDAQLHWAEFSAKIGWTGAWGVWVG